MYIKKMLRSYNFLYESSKSAFLPQPTCQWTAESQYTKSRANPTSLFFLIPIWETDPSNFPVLGSLALPYPLRFELFSHQNQPGGEISIAVVFYLCFVHLPSLLSSPLWRFLDAIICHWLTRGSISGVLEGNFLFLFNGILLCSVWIILQRFVCESGQMGCCVFRI